MNRRDFLKSAGAISAAGVSVSSVTPGLVRKTWAAAKTPESFEPISTPIEKLETEYDTVVIGSGYGGSILAARLAGTRNLCVLERGQEWLPGKFPKNVIEAAPAVRTDDQPTGLYDFHFHDELDVLVGSGLGGTSLINANVAIEPDARLFDLPEWPEEIRQARDQGALGRCYDAARANLRVESSEVIRTIPRCEIHRASTEKLGGKFVYADLAVTLAKGDEPNAAGIRQPNCSLCGDCVTGCNYGAKNTLNMNYLPLARKNGAQIFTRVEAEILVKHGERDYEILYIHHSEHGPVRGTIRCKEVILSAGTLGSTRLLLRSQADGGIRVSDKLGSRVSGNGDVMGMSYNGDEPADSLGFGLTDKAPSQLMRVGPTITGIADFRQTADVREGRILEDGAFPSSLVDILRVFMAMRACIDGAGNLGRRLIDTFMTSRNGALNHSLLYLGMGHDPSEGRMSLDDEGKIRVKWETMASAPVFDAITDQMTRHANALGGSFEHPDPRAPKDSGRHLMTVHPLGGCPMGSAADSGVVDHAGRVFNPEAGLKAVHQGLYVADGSIIPTALGVNPFLTISALSERIAGLILAEKPAGNV